MYTLHYGHDGVVFHFPKPAPQDHQVRDHQRLLECFGLQQVHGHVGQRRVPHGVDRKRVTLDRTERAIGDPQLIDGRDECSRRQPIRRQVFQRHLNA